MPVSLQNQNIFDHINMVLRGIYNMFLGENITRRYMDRPADSQNTICLNKINRLDLVAHYNAGNLFSLQRDLKPSPPGCACDRGNQGQENFFIEYPRRKDQGGTPPFVSCCRVEIRPYKITTFRDILSLVRFDRLLPLQSPFDQVQG